MNSEEKAAKQGWALKFYTIFSGQALSILGSSLVQFALIWYLTQKTGSATVLAMSTLAGILPETLLSPLAGTLADRWNRRTMMILADLLVASATVLLAFLFVSGAIQIWHIYAILVFRSAAGTFHYSAMNASTTMLVPSEQLQRVSGINQSLRAGINIIAPPTGALLLGLLPIQGILFIDVSTALMAVLPLLFLGIPQPKRELDEQGHHKTSVTQDMKDGFLYIRSWPGLMAIIGMALIANFLLTPTGSLMPLLVTQHFGLGALQFGLMDSIWAFGMVIGGILLGVWGGFKKKIATAMMGVIGIGLGIIIVGLAPANMFWLAIAGMTLSGMMNPITNGPLSAIVQAEVRPEFQGRVMGTILSLSTLMTPISLVIAGPVSDILGIRFWYLVAGAVSLLMGIGAFFTPLIMNVEGERAKAAQQSSAAMVIADQN